MELLSNRHTSRHQRGEKCLKMREAARGRPFRRDLQCQQSEVDAGATDDGKPGPRPDYGEPYYGSFLRDPDGHKIEAAFWDDELARRLGMA